MKKSTLALVMIFAILALALTGCGQKDTPATPAEPSPEVAQEPASEEPIAEEYSVTIDNFNRQVNYTEIPERIVSLSYSETEILVALGLEDKIVGIAEADNTIEVVSEEYRDTVKGLNIIAKSEDGGVPTLEVVLAQTPDFIYGTSYSFNPSYGVGAIEDFEANGINVYASTSTYKPDASIEDTYTDILNIGKIFHVEERAEELVAQMKSQVSAITEKISGEKPVSVFIFDSGDATPFTFYGNSYEGTLVTLAGGENVFAEIEGGFGQVGWEAVVAANPDFIIVNDWGGGSGAAPVEDKINYIKGQPELQEITAVKEDNFVAVHLEQVSFGGLQNPVAIEAIAEALHPGCFE